MGKSDGTLISKHTENKKKKSELLFCCYENPEYDDTLDILCSSDHPLLKKQIQLREEYKIIHHRYRKAPTQG